MDAGRSGARLQKRDRWRMAQAFGCLAAFWQQRRPNEARCEKDEAGTRVRVRASWLFLFSSCLASYGRGLGLTGIIDNLKSNVESFLSKDRLYC
eukprot:scaffold16098_cov80-Skeletonema_menzelii.AAC.7